MKRPNIRAHIATFPARSHIFMDAIMSVYDDVDEIYLVLNEYNEVPAELAKYPKINPILPKDDQKDAGKFLTQPNESDWVFFLDDGLIYAQGYIDRSISSSEKLEPERAVYGIHGSIYLRRAITKNKMRRDLFAFKHKNKVNLYVHQIGTGTMFTRGKYVPPYEYMETSKQFVDIRNAKWCFENKIDVVCLAHSGKRIRTNPKMAGVKQTIYKTFTSKSEKQLIGEVSQFARESLKIGSEVAEK